MLVLLAVALTAGGCFGDAAVAVETEEVRTGAVTQTVAAPGRVDAAARQDVAAVVSGVVAAVDVADGELVEAGQPVVRLESEDVDAALAQAAAAQAAAASGAPVRIEGAGAGTRQTTYEAVLQLDATVPPRIAEARAAAGEIDDADRRAAALAAIDAVEAAYLTTRQALLSAGYAIADQQDHAARALSDALNQALRQAGSGQRAQAEAAAAAAARQEEHLVLGAPFAGVVRLGRASASSGLSLAGFGGGIFTGSDLTGVGGLNGDSGGTLRPGAPVAAGRTLFTVFDLSAMYVVTDVDEVDVPQVATGQEARVLIDAFPTATIGGVVESVPVEASTTETGATGYQVRIRLLPTDGELPDLRVGMTASADIVTREVTAETVVPSRALLRRDGRTVVFVVRDGMASEVPVEVIALGEDAAAVEGSLRRGDQVVVSGYEDLRDGGRVTAR